MTDREDKGLPQVDSSGWVIVESLSLLSRVQLTVWIRLVLLEEDAAVGSSHGELPQTILRSTYERLDVRTRSVFEDSLIDLLSQLVRRSDQGLVDRGGDALLQVLPSVFAASVRKKAPVDWLLRIASHPSVWASGEPNLHLRSLQSLVALGYRVRREILVSQFDHGREEYAGVVWAGLRLFSIRTAFDWLRVHAGRPAIVTVMLRTLPRLAEEHSIEELSVNVRELLGVLPPEEHDQVVSAAQRLGIDCTLQHAGGGILADWADDAINVLARDVAQLRGHRADEPREVEDVVREYLTQILLRQDDLREHPPSVAAMIAAAREIRTAPSDFSASTRRHIVEMIQQLISGWMPDPIASSEHATLLDLKRSWVHLNDDLKHVRRELGKVGA